MATNKDLEEEVNELRGLMSARQATDIQQLQQSLLEAKRESEHYRSEANRNAEVGRKIAADYQGQLVELRLQLDAATKREVHDRRFGAK